MVWYWIRLCSRLRLRLWRLADTPLKERLHISKKAHLILPTHRILDAAYEAAKGDAKVGTTGKGIGPYLY